MELFAHIPALFKAFFLAFLTAYSRLYLERSELSYIQRLAEGTFCGFFALGLVYGCRSVGMNEDLGIFLGACVGCIGSKTVRALAQSWATKKVGK